MGLSSSQARLLNLTSRMHQIEYKAARLEAEKLQMANESDRVYDEYLDALDKTKIQRKKLTTDGAITYVDLTDYTDFNNAGFAIVRNGVTYDGATTSKRTADGIYYETVATGQTAVAAGDSNALLYGVQPGNWYLNRRADGTYEATQTQLSTTSVNLNWSQLLIDLGITVVNDFETCLTNIIQSGEVTIVTKDANGDFLQPLADDFHLYETSVATNTNLREEKDEVLLKKAEAKYEADMKKIDRKERKYDADLATFDNERNAIKQEMETLKTVAKDNVDRTFKLFS